MGDQRQQQQKGKYNQGQNRQTKIYRPRLVGSWTHMYLFEPIYGYNNTLRLILTYSRLPPNPYHFVQPKSYGLGGSMGGGRYVYT